MDRLQCSDSQTQVPRPDGAEQHRASSMLVSVLERRVSVGLWSCSAGLPFLSCHACVGISCAWRSSSCGWLHLQLTALRMFPCVEVSKESFPLVAAPQNMRKPLRLSRSEQFFVFFHVFMKPSEISDKWSSASRWSHFFLPPWWVLPCVFVPGVNSFS